MRYQFFFALTMLCPAADEACLPCHRQAVESWRASTMARSVGAVIQAKASFRHDFSNTKMSVAGDEHVLERDGLRARYRIGLRIGSGNKGMSFATQQAGMWMQSPISWYAAQKRFAVSPGWEQEKYPDADRPVRDECLQCHASRVEQTWQPISCDRCHGDSAAHLRKPLRTNIVQPARLAKAARDSVCEQCHLPGVARIPLAGKKLHDFQPGMHTEDVWTTWIRSDAPMKVASHAERLALSRCQLQQSKDIWCGSCHSPHADAQEQLRATQAVCQGCHAASAKPHFAQQSCTKCHMPQKEAADVHAAYTDHRIQIPARSESVSVRQQLLEWRPTGDGARGAALALMEVIDSTATTMLAMEKLQGLPAGDVSVWTARGAAALRLGNADAAVDYFLRATRMDAVNPWLQYQLAMARAAAGQPGVTEPLRQALLLNPGFLEAAIALAQEERRSKGNAAYLEVLDEFLRHRPQSLAVRQAVAKARRGL
jgi:predicted CXXCH cytochrome family protein